MVRTTEKITVSRIKTVETIEKTKNEKISESMKEYWKEKKLADKDKKIAKLEKKVEKLKEENKELKKELE